MNVNITHIRPEVGMTCWFWPVDLDDRITFDAACEPLAATILWVSHAERVNLLVHSPKGQAFLRSNRKIIQPGECESTLGGDGPQHSYVTWPDHVIDEAEIQWIVSHQDGLLGHGEELEPEFQAAVEKIRQAAMDVIKNGPGAGSGAAEVNVDLGAGDDMTVTGIRHRLELGVKRPTLTDGDAIADLLGITRPDNPTFMFKNMPADATSDGPMIPVCMKLQPHQVRVIQERNRVASDHAKLVAFMTCPVFQELDVFERARLTRQELVMLELRDILDERIEAWEPTKEELEQAKAAYAQERLAVETEAIEQGLQNMKDTIARLRSTFAAGMNPLSEFDRSLMSALDGLHKSLFDGATRKGVNLSGGIWDRYLRKGE